MKRHKMQPLAVYSTYVMEYSAIGQGEETDTQEFINLFVELRDKNIEQYKIDAAELLTQKSLTKNANGVTFHYILAGRDFYCTTSPASIKSLEHPLIHSPLGWRKSTNRIILVDRIADCEARAILNYSTQD